MVTSIESRLVISCLHIGLGIRRIPEYGVQSGMRFLVVGVPLGVDADDDEADGEGPEQVVVDEYRRGGLTGHDPSRWRWQSMLVGVYLLFKVHSKSACCRLLLLLTLWFPDADCIQANESHQ